MSMYKLYWVLILNFLDYILTAIALLNSSIKEINPLINNFGLLQVKIIGLLILSVIAYIAYRRNKKAYDYAMNITIVMYIVIVLNNIYWIVIS